MELFLSNMINSIMQIVLFVAIPLVWWILSARKQISFLNWIGLKKVESFDKGSLFKWTGITTAIFLFLSIFMLSMVSGVEKATSDFTGLGLTALPAALIYAFLKTALSEEILFRGFLLKRLSGKFGFQIGNAVQSILFGLTHGLMFVALVGAFKATLIILFTGAIGWSMGYINERKAGGSILPGWLIHGIANTFSALIAAFSII
ncbi:MAG: CPBP family intramembrane glutamic endopeptidase [Bacillota bacterium]